MTPCDNPSRPTRVAWRRCAADAHSHAMNARLIPAALTLLGLAVAGCDDHTHDADAAGIHAIAHNPASTTRAHDPPIAPARTTAHASGASATRPARRKRTAGAMRSPKPVKSAAWGSASRPAPVCRTTRKRYPSTAPIARKPPTMGTKPSSHAPTASARRVGAPSGCNGYLRAPRYTAHNAARSVCTISRVIIPQVGHNRTASPASALNRQASARCSTRHRPHQRIAGGAASPSTVMSGGDFTAVTLSPPRSHANPDLQGV